MKFLVLFLLLSSSLMAAPGFFNPTDPNIPVGLKSASDSVFEIKTAFFEDFENYEDISIYDVTKVSTSDLDEMMSKSYKDPKDLAVARAFLNLCKTPEKKAQCPVPIKINNGSSFITGNGSTLWTNAHVMDKVIKMKAAGENKSALEILQSKITMPIFIFDKNGTMIFNGLEEQISFKALPKSTQLTKMKKDSFYAEDSDYLAIVLPKPIGKPLKVARQLHSNDIAVIGYPLCTGCEAPEGYDPQEFASRHPYPDAEDCEEKITGGQLIMPETWGQMAQVNQYLENALDRSTFISHTADSHYGMSGAPLLNRNGEVVGIHAGGKTVQTFNGTQRFSRGVRPPELFNEP